MKVTVAAISLFLAVDVNASTQFRLRRTAERAMQVVDENECTEDYETPFPDELDYIDGFCSSLPDFQLNSNILNYPTYLEDCALRLTSDGVKNAIASAYLPLSIIDDDFAFSTHIKYRIYGRYNGSADGMAFVGCCAWTSRWTSWRLHA